MLDAIFLTDLHLGAGMCQAEPLLFLLKDLPKTKLVVLGGDVLQSLATRLKRKHWAVLDELRHIARDTPLIWVRGNHDHDAEAVARLVGAVFLEEHQFVSGDKKCLVVHGDRWDGFASRFPIATAVADYAYLALQNIDPRLASRAKAGSKTFLECALKVRNGAVKLAQELGCDIVLCGHTHFAEQCEVSGINYTNAGCWTEHCCHYVTLKNGVVKLKEVRST